MSSAVLFVLLSVYNGSKMVLHQYCCCCCIRFWVWSLSRSVQSLNYGVSKMKVYTTISCHLFPFYTFYFQLSFHFRFHFAAQFSLASLWLWALNRQMLQFITLDESAFWELRGGHCGGHTSPHLFSQHFWTWKVKVNLSFVDCCLLTSRKYYNLFALVVILFHMKWSLLSSRLQML